jgi:hypothetical protein
VSLLTIALAASAAVPVAVGPPAADPPVGGPAFLAVAEGARSSRTVAYDKVVLGDDDTGQAVAIDGPGLYGGPVVTA